jgi:hypothetical protein
MLKGEEAVTVPVRVPLPVLVTVKSRSLELPTVTSPKSKEVGVTESRGLDTSVPVPLKVTLASPPSELTLTVPVKVPVPVGLKRTVMVRLTPVPRLKEPPETMLKGAEVVAVPVRVPPPTLVTVKLRSLLLSTVTLPKAREVGVTDRRGTCS